MMEERTGSKDNIGEEKLWSLIIFSLAGEEAEWGRDKLQSYENT